MSAGDTVEKQRAGKVFGWGPDPRELWIRELSTRLADDVPVILLSGKEL